MSEPRDEAKRVLRGHHAPMMHIVYVLENTNDYSWYIGQNDDLKRRLSQHNSGQGGRTTKTKEGSWKLIYAEAYCHKNDALGREKFLKGGSGRKYLKKQLAFHSQSDSNQNIRRSGLPFTLTLIFWKKILSSILNKKS